MLELNDLLKKVATGAALSVLLCTGVRAQSDNADTPRPESPQNAIKPIERQQSHVGENIRKSSDDLIDLIEDLKQNSIKEIDPMEINNDSRRLEEVIQKHMPEVTRALISAGSHSGDGVDDLRASVKSADNIVRILQDLTAKMKRDLEQPLLVRMLNDLIKKFSDAQEKTRDARLLHDNLDSKPADKMTDSERNALRDAGEKQKEAAADVKKTIADLKHEADKLEPTDKITADAIRKTVSDLEKSEIQNKADGASDDVANKKFNSAEKKNDDVLTALRSAEKNLAKTVEHDPAADLEKRAAALNDAKGKQEKTMADTRDVKPGDDKGLAEAMNNQGDVSKMLHNLKQSDPSSPGLSDAARASTKALDSLSNERPQEALKNQQDVLNAINAELASVASKLAKDSKNAPKKDGPMGQFAYAAVKTIASVGWSVALPPKDRDDVEQAVKNKMPAKYARQIMLYYENLAGAKPDDNK